MSWVIGGALALALAVPIPIGAATGPDPRAWQGHLEPQWEIVTKSPFAPLAPAPRGGVIYLHGKQDGSRFSIQRLESDLAITWTSRWRTHRETLARISPSAVAVSSGHDRVVVAAEGVCRSPIARQRGRGPILLRGYSLSTGHRIWARSIGRCAASGGHRERILDVSGLDVRGGQAAMSFTQGAGTDIRPHTRRGHVMAFDVANGRTRWNTELTFATLGRDVVTNDVAVSRRLVAVVGVTDTVKTFDDAFLTALDRWSGSVRWKVRRGGEIRDWYDTIDATKSTLYLTGTFGDAPEGGGGHGVLERRSTSGERQWQRRVPPMSSVNAIAGAGVVWGVVAGNRRGHPFVVGRRRADGTRVWQQEWDVASFATAVQFEAVRHRIYLGAGVVNDRGHEHLHSWCWRWR